MSEKQKIVTVADIQDDQDFIFVSDSQDTQFIKDSLAFFNKKNFDSFFVKIENGEYTSIYGMEGIIPNLEKRLTKIL